MDTVDTIVIGTNIKSVIGSSTVARATHMIGGIGTTMVGGTDTIITTTRNFITSCDMAIATRIAGMTDIGKRVAINCAADTAAEHDWLGGETWDKSAAAVGDPIASLTCQILRTYPDHSVPALKDWLESLRFENPQLYLR